MKNHKLFWISLTLALLFITGCSRLNLSPSPYDSTELNQNENILFQTEQEMYETGTQDIVVEVINRTEEEIGYGIAFSLEKKEEEGWMVVEPVEDVAFIEIALMVFSGDTGRDTVNLDHYPTLPPGQYRIVRSIKGAFYTAEFLLED